MCDVNRIKSFRIGRTRRELAEISAISHHPWVTLTFSSSCKALLPVMDEYPSWLGGSVLSKSLVA